MAYSFDFDGDGVYELNSSSNGRQTHTYTRNGSYTASVKVKDQQGLESAPVSIQVQVGSPAAPPPANNNPPVARYTADVTSGNAPLTVRFDGSTSSDPDGDAIVRYDFDFGDGNTGSGVNVSHVYSTAGQYPAKLTVTDARGAKATVQGMNIQVSAASTATPTPALSTPAVGASSTGSGNSGGGAFGAALWLLGVGLLRRRARGWMQA